MQHYHHLHDNNNNNNNNNNSRKKGIVHISLRTKTVKCQIYVTCPSRCQLLHHCTHLLKLVMQKMLICVHCPLQHHHFLLLPLHLNFKLIGLILIVIVIYTISFPLIRHLLYEQYDVPVHQHQTRRKLSHT